MKVDGLLAHYEQIADAAEAIPRLRRFILDLAIRGKLVDQDSNDEPASELLKQIAAEKARLVRLKIIKARRASAPEFHSVLPFDLPVGWTLVRVEEVLVELQTGPFGSSLHQSDYQLGGVPVVNPASIQNERIVPVSKMAVGPTTLARLASFKLQTGDVILARRGEMGRCAVVMERESGWLCGTGSLILRSFKCIYPRFLSMLIGSPFSRQYLSGTAVGTTMQNLNQTILLNLPLGLPPLAEQHRIVAKVNELMALCDRLQAAQTDRETTRNRLATASLARLNAPDPDSTTFQNHAAFALENITPLTTRPEQIKALRQTILNLAVRGKLVAQNSSDEPAPRLLERIVESKGRSRGGIESISEPYGLPAAWTWAALDKLITTGPQNGISPKPTTQTDAPKAITLTATTSGTFKPNNFKHVEANVSDDSELWLRDGDLLFQRGNTREYVGIAAIYEGPSKSFLFPDLMMRVRVSPLVNLRFVHLAAISPPARAYFSENASGAQATMPKINQTTLVSLPIPLPPLVEQHRIVAKVDELMALCDRLEESLTISTETRRRLFDAALQDALEPDVGTEATA